MSERERHTISDQSLVKLRIDTKRGKRSLDYCALKARRYLSFRFLGSDWKNLEGTKRNYENR